MKPKIIVVVIAFLALTSPGDIQTGRADTTPIGRSIAGAVTTTAQASTTPISQQDTAEVRHASQSVPVHVEPLLLLLFWSTLFCLGTAIKLVLSRNFARNRLV